jgi:four helix bundle protein
MRENKLADLSMCFSVRVIELMKVLQEKKEYIISKQIGRSGTSIGANIREANYAQSKADFISKMHIALKEANETGYWIELLEKTGYINKEDFEKMNNECTSIRVMLIRSIKTAKGLVSN